MKVKKKSMLAVKQGFSVMCAGHVTAATFNKVWKANWPTSGERFEKSDLTYEYWRKRPGRNTWSQATPETKGAKPFTVAHED